jgi:hypothetical protein
MTRGPPAALTASGQKPYFFLAFLAPFLAAFFFAGISDHLPSSKTVQRSPSEQSALTPGQALGLPGAGQPFLELSPGDPPDTTDPDRGYPRRVRIVHRAESAQDGRGVNAQAPRDLIGREVFVLIVRPDCARCGSCVSGPSLLHLREYILPARVKRRSERRIAARSVRT